MSHKKLWVSLSLCLVIVMLLSACAPAPTPAVIYQTVEVEGTPQVELVVATPVPPEPVTGPKTLIMAAGEGDVPTIDTAMAVDQLSIQIVESTSVGLVRQNEETANLEKGMAESYEVTDDGLKYTFHLRQGIPWVTYNGQEVVAVKDCEGNDRMVTAEDFRYGILRTLDPATASDYAYVLNPVIVGAADFNAGTVTDPETVGVKAIDAQTLEVTVTNPAVYNLNILGLWVAHAQPKWIIEGDDCTDARGERWTETGFFQGYGPYTLKEWVHDASLTMIKNPLWNGTDEIPAPKIDLLTYRFLGTSQGLAEYEAGNIDIAYVPAADWDRVSTAPEYKDAITLVQTIGVEFYGFNVKLPPTDDVRVRQALSLAIDRQAIVSNVNKDGIPALWFTHPGATGSPSTTDDPDFGIKYDPERAKALMDEYLKEKGITADQINLTLLFNTSEGHKKRAEAVQQMWKDTLGINTTLLNQERAVFFKQRGEGKENVYRGSWVQDYPDANNFMNDVFGKDGGYYDVMDWNSGPEYDKFLELIQEAALEQDPAKRVDLYKQAETILVLEQAVVSPVYWYSTPQLTNPKVMKINSITGYDHFEKWDITQ